MHPILLPFSLCFIILFHLLFPGRDVFPQRGQPEGQAQILEEYEKEKRSKMKRNIGRRYLIVRSARPVEFFRSPEESNQGFVIQKEKEGFLITEVIQNLSGTMNFYYVLFDSGETGYLGADGNYLEIKTLDRSLIPLGKRDWKGKGQPPLKGSFLKAVEMVKSHLIKIDPMTGGRISVESRMKEIKSKVSPHLKWTYEAQGINPDRVRVIQWSEGEEPTLIIRTWVVDLFPQRVLPENISAQKLYR